MRLTGWRRKEAAKDIVSELFGDIWSQYDRWRPDNRRAYLTRAVRNRCLNYLKHKAVERDTLGKYLDEKRTLVGTDLQEQEELMKRVRGHHGRAAGADPLRGGAMLSRRTEIQRAGRTARHHARHDSQAHQQGLSDF